MNNAPKQIALALRDQIIRPIVEYLTGRRPLRQIEHLLSSDVARRLREVHPVIGDAEILDILGQVLPGVAALEVAVSVRIGDRPHAIAIRIETRQEQPVVAELEAPSILS